MGSVCHWVGERPERGIRDPRIGAPRLLLGRLDDVHTASDQLLMLGFDVIAPECQARELSDAVFKPRGCEQRQARIGANYW